ncbi:hypothetical protein QH494_22780 [Sphingomonas sp. AR_OL41]|uniref:hypothetical protein n=1 Tax=Sphingomonas sp. AR_OL41 TaxID=3042729 RepID=UPI00248167FE|nr:hypothetical protein [Sphingomonas sp. AR_OL41]MDH7975019.1 hypothetical protein [Sphingomonas sp. AR_OL41]
MVKHARAEALPDGLDALRGKLALHEIMVIIEQTARWVHPETFALLPVWYPEFTRGMHVAAANWTLPRMRSNGAESRETNDRAQTALTKALGLRSGLRRNWTCCHIWGVDDPAFTRRNTIVRDPRFYSCVGNMVLLPTPLKAFTDAVPEVKGMIRLCARNMYGRTCGPDNLVECNLDAYAADQAYPASWPKIIGDAVPQGTMETTEGIRHDVKRRIDNIRSDLECAGPLYPRDSVRQTLAYWNIMI